MEDESQGLFWTKAGPDWNLQWPGLLALEGAEVRGRGSEISESGMWWARKESRG